MTDVSGSHTANELQIAGVEPFSSCDWPNQLAATVFLQGCPWRCEYCHNVDIIDPRAPGVIAWAQVREILAQRVGLLDGVVFSGGEPTRQIALTDAARAVKEMGFKVGLHTGGAYPNRIRALLPYLDWVGLDIKATPGKYPAITGVPGDDRAAFETLHLLTGAGVDVQVRTTLDPLVLDEDDIIAIREKVNAAGVEDYVVQRVRTQGTSTQYAQALEAYRSSCHEGQTAIRPLHDGSSLN